jgi:hypothetical protein
VRFAGNGEIVTTKYASSGSTRSVLSFFGPLSLVFTLWLVYYSDSIDLLQKNAPGRHKDVGVPGVLCRFRLVLIIGVWFGRI